MKAPKDNKDLLATLKPVWVAYGHTVPFEQLDGFKLRAYDHCYVVVRWKEDGKVMLADLYRTHTSHAWEMQNDEYEAITEAQWKKLYIPEECDWFEIDE